MTQVFSPEVDGKTFRWQKFQIMGDDRGSLISLEGGKNIPFDIKRLYYIFDTSADVRRGAHAHRNLKQVAFCIAGSCSFLLDDGETKETLHLNRPDYGILLSSMVWREMFDFSRGCVLAVLASEHYNTDDYIYDYKLFQSEADAFYNRHS